jgi:hypothetical protein
MMAHITVSAPAVAFMAAEGKGQVGAPLLANGGTDTAITDLHRAYFAALEDECRICAMPEAPVGSAEDKARDNALGETGDRQFGAVHDLSQHPAMSLDGLRLKAEVHQHAVKIYVDGHGEIEPDTPAFLLGVSIAADLMRLVPSEGAQA